MKPGWTGQPEGRQPRAHEGLNEGPGELEEPKLEGSGSSSWSPHQGSAATVQQYGEGYLENNNKVGEVRRITNIRNKYAYLRDAIASPRRLGSKKTLRS